MKDCPDSFHYPDLLASLKTQKLISAPPESFFVLAEQRYLRRAGLHPETLCQAASMQDFRFLLNQQFAMGLFPLSQIHNTDQFAHIPLEPSAHYYLQIVYKKALYNVLTKKTHVPQRKTTTTMFLKIRRFPLL